MPVSFTVNRSTLLHTDSDGDGFADAGDVLRHTLVLTNTGDTDAGNVTVNDTLLGSTETGLMNISPIAFNDSFTAVGNTTLRVGTAGQTAVGAGGNLGTGPSSIITNLGNLLSNDSGSTTVGTGALTGDDVTGFTITTVTNGASAHGTFNIFADGSFNYIANAGFTGTDTFTYTIHDNGIDGVDGTGDETSSTGTVTITVANKVWYVDNTAAAGGDGTSWHPFDSLSDVTGATGPDAAGDIIYVGSGSGNYDGGITLLNNQELHGAGTALTVGGFNLASAGSDPTIVNTGATNGSHGVVVGTGNTLTGFTVGNTGGYDIANTTTSTVGNLTISNVDLTGTGGLFRADSGGNLTVTFDNATTTGTAAGINGIQLGGALTGGFTTTAGAISGVDAGGTDVLINGGTETVSLANSIASSTGGSIDIGSHNGAVTLSGALNITGGSGISVHNNTGGTIAFSNASKVVNTGGANAVTLSTNTGATINFTNGGLDIDTTGGHGFTATGGGTVSVSGSGNSIASTLAAGTALDLSGVQVGGSGITFATLNTTGASNGILIASVSQAAGSTGIDILGGAITNAGTRGVDIDSTSADVTVNSTISTAAGGRSVEVTNSGATGSGSIINFGGAIDDNGLGINLDNNDASNGATINFTGGLDIDAAAGQTGFNATNGGTINVTGAGNSIVTGTGRALNVTNTTIGASGLSFHDISSSGAANGIVLTSTGAGSLTVNGGGAAGTGGTISGSTGTGILLTNTGAISLTGMIVQTSADDGIGGNNVNGLTLNNSNILNNGNAVGDRGIDMIDLKGSGGMSGTTVSGSAETNVRIENDNATLTAFNVTNSTISNTNFTTGDDGMLVLLTGSGAMNVSVTGSTFTDNKGDHFQAATDADATGQMNITFNNNTLTTTASHRDGAGGDDAVGGGITVNTSGSADIVFSINNNTLTWAFDDAVNINLDPGSLAGASMTGTINNNTIGISGSQFSGSKSSHDVTVAAKGHGLLDIDVLNNHLFEWGNEYGIFLQDTEGNAHMVAKVTGNIMHTTVAGNALLLNGIHVEAGATAGDNGLLEVVLTGNDVAGEAGAGQTDIRLRQRFNTTIKLPGYGGANNDNAAVQTYVAGTNAGATVSAINNVAGGGGGYIGGSATPLTAAAPPPLHAPGDPGDKSYHDGTGGQFLPPPPPPAYDPNGSDLVDGGTGNAPAAPPAADPGAPDTPPAPPSVVDDGILTRAELDMIVDAAIGRWAAAGATPAEIAAMREVIFTVDDLDGLVLGSSTIGHVTLDSNAAGFNWFIDTTPDDDSEYKGEGTDLHADPSTAAGARIDLLTTVMHELGHQIGLADVKGAANSDDLMYATINPGERRLPDGEDVALATGTPGAGTDFALSPVNLGTVQPGRTVTIQWDSTVDVFINQMVPSYANHSTVAWTTPSVGNQVSNTETLSGTSPGLALDSLTLGGTVWNDNGAGGGIANNGVRDGTEPGIDGVLVSLLVDANNDDVPDSSTPIATVLTAGGGLYSFSVAPGNYIVRIDQDNFDAGGNTSLVNLPSSSANAPDQPDPDDDVDNDDNGSRAAGQPAFSKTITLSNNSEPTSTGVNHANTNTTLDFGFVKVNTAPAFAGVDGTPAFTEGGSAVVLDNNATASDADLSGTNYAGATLTLARSGGAVADDSFGTTGTLAFTGAGSGNVTVGATTVGTYTQGGGTLVITFNANATQALVNSTLQQLTYSNGSDNPPASALIAYAFSDGNAGAQGSGGALSANGSVTVNITPVNDAPVAALSNHSLGAAIEQQAFSLKAAGLSVSDVDGNSGSETVTLSVGQGVLNVSAGTSGAGVSGSGTGTVTLTGTVTQINALLNTDGTSSVDYVSNSDTPPASTSITLTIHDNGATGGGDLSASDNGTISITAVNDEPTLSATAGNPTFTENGAAVNVFSGTLASTVESGQTLTSLTLTVTNVTDGANEVLGIDGSSVALTNGNAVTTSVNGLNVSVSLSGTTATVSFSGATLSQTDVQTLIDTLTYADNGDNPTVADRVVTIIQLVDSGSNAAPDDNTATLSVSSTVHISAADDVPTAVADAYATNENAVLLVPAAGVLSNDTDPDAGPKNVVSVNGVMANVGVAVTLTSGAKVTLNADGSLSYDPNHKFDTLTSTASGETGAVNTSELDSFTYAVNGGSSTTVTITVNGVVSVQDHLDGDSSNNVITGTPNGDFFDLSQGGDDTASGLGANDGFFFGAAFTGADQVDGGGGTNDQIGLQGDYTGPNALVLGPNTISNIEAIVVLPGFNYDITTDDGNVPLGGVLKVQATSLGAGNSLTFDGSAETDGSFLVYGGQGNDTMTGGAGNDGFYFGPGGFNSSDTVNGGAGNNDQLALDGNYGGFGPPFVLGGNITNVEVVVLLPGPSGSPNTFNLSTSDALVPTGQTMTIFGLQVATNIVFDGSSEHDGAFRIYGGSGNDIFTGSTGNDWIFGGYGGDLLTGGAGADTYYFDDAAQSTSLGFDKIFGFDDSVDTIDVPFAVTGLATPASGNLSNASFDADLSTAFAGLTSHEAGMFTATGGDMAGRTFLVIDADGNAGYQAGSDYVIEIVTPVTPIDNPAIFV